MIDREDLQNLKNHYRDVYEDVDTIRLEPFEEGLPRALLEIGWRSHRRQILGAVEVLVQLAVESIALDARRANPALFGSRELRSRFRRTLSDSLGILVSLSVNSVSPSLLRLAADTRPGVQPITARALAGWYQHNRSSRLFDLLDEWQRNTEWIAFVEALLQELGGTSERTPVAPIRITLVLTLAEILKQIPANDIPPTVLDLVEDLAFDHDEGVVKVYGQKLLPIAVGIHLNQLRVHVEGLVEEGQYVRAISRGLGWAFGYRQAEVERLLDDWTSNALSTTRTSRDGSDLTEREHRLTTVVLTYAAVRYRAGHRGTQARFTVQEGFARIRALLAPESGESHPYVRRQAIDAVSRLCRYYFDEIEDGLKGLIAELDIKERDLLVNRLGRIYLAQRQELKGGEATFDHGNQTYQIWINYPRPKMPIEEAMGRWIDQPDRAEAAAQVAYKTEGRFLTLLEHAEKVRRDQLRRDQKTVEPEENQQEEVRDLLDRRVDSLPFYERWIPVLATRKIDPRLRRSVGKVLPEVLRQDAVERRAQFQKYRATGRAPLAHALESALQWKARSRGVLTLFVILVVCSAILLVWGKVS